MSKLIKMIKSFSELNNACQKDIHENLCVFYLRSIRPDLRGMGIGTYMMKAQINYLKSTMTSGKMMVKSCIYESNTASLALAKKFGFAVTRRIDTPNMEKNSSAKYGTMLELVLDLNDVSAVN
jgi:RimJ/RimL family protein N-acetyltransferase